MGESGDKKLQPGSMVGGFRVEHELGAGGLGTVYAGEEPKIKKRVAIKVLKRAFADDEASVARFELEARAANAIHHPGIIDVFAFGRLDDGRPYLVMSLLEGKSLRDELSARERFAPREAWAVLREVAGALAAAHDQGIVHRDLKPDNVFLERFEGVAPRPRLLDFGIAKLQQTEDGEALQKLTLTGTPIGTPRYMAPEQWWSQPITPRTDQYAFGVMLFEMLAGRAPFLAQQFMELVQQHVHDPPPTLASAGVAVPEPVEQLVARTLAKSPDDRFASMRDLVAAGDLAFAALDGVSGGDDGLVRAAGLASATPAPGPGSGVAPTPSAHATPSQPSGPAAQSTPAIAAVTPGDRASASSTVVMSTEVARPMPRAPINPVRRFLAIHFGALALVFAAIVAIGYAGEDAHNPKQWFLIGGFAQWGTLALAIIGALVLGVLAGRRAKSGSMNYGAVALAISPGLHGTFGTYLGWHAVMRHIGDSNAPQAFSVVNQGMYEANATRLFGFAVSTAFSISLAAMPGVSGLWNPTRTLVAAVGLASREAVAAAGTLIALALVAVAVGAPSAAFVAGVAAAVLLVGVALPTLHADTAARDEIERAMAGLLAVAFASALAFTRVEAREAVLWNGDLTRAERVAEILAAHAERVATTALTLASLAVVMGVEVLRLRRLFKRAGRLRLTTGTAAVGIVLCLGVVGDSVVHGRFVGSRDALRASIAEEFALFARLEPPTAGEHQTQRFPTHRSTAMQVTRDAVAVNAKGVAKLSTLESGDGAARVAHDLSSVLAQAAVELTEASQVDLTMFIDREVPVPAVMDLLRIASEAGAKHVDIVLQKGPPPEVPVDAPAEAHIVVPSDFIALPVVLSDKGDVAFDAKGRFGAAAALLDARAQTGAVPIRLGLRRPDARPHEGASDGAPQQ